MSNRKTPYKSTGKATVVSKVKHESLMLVKDNAIAELEKQLAKANSQVLQMEQTNKPLAAEKDILERSLKSAEKALAHYERIIARNELIIDKLIGFNPVQKESKSK